MKQKRDKQWANNNKERKTKENTWEKLDNNRITNFPFCSLISNNTKTGVTTLLTLFRCFRRRIFVVIYFYPVILFLFSVYLLTIHEFSWQLKQCCKFVTFYFYLKYKNINSWTEEKFYNFFTIERKRISLNKFCF